MIVRELVFKPVGDQFHHLRQNRNTEENNNLRLHGFQVLVVRCDEATEAKQESAVEHKDEKQRAEIQNLKEKLGRVQLFVVCASCLEVLVHCNIHASDDDEREKGHEEALHLGCPVFNHRLGGVLGIRNHIVDLGPLEKDHD